MPTERRPALKKPVSSRAPRWRESLPARVLPNLGPKTSAWLRAEGLRTRDDLVAVGAVEACRRLRVAGFPVTLLAAYGIEAGLMGVHWNALPVEFKRHLVVDFRRMQRAHPIRPRPQS